MAFYDKIGSATPVGSVTPDFLNQFFQDTTTKKLYYAKGLTNADWALIGSGIGDLLAANNLSDLASVVTARANLGLGSAATQPTSAFDPAGAASAVQANLMSHTGDTGNPHATTKAQVGLSAVPNVDATNPSNITQDSTHRFVTDAEKSTWNGKQAALGFTPEDSANKGAANGYCPLDSGAKIASTYLPSFVDDVLEYANLTAFPGTGETGKIYVTLDTNKTYRWSGSAYVEISASPGSTDAVTEGSTNLYFTAARVLATVLSGLSTATNAAITSADTVLSALGKLQKQITDLITTVAGKEPTITAGSTAQYWRGDKTWQTLPTGAGYTLQVCANSTLALLVSSPTEYVFTGKTGGQKVALPDATTLTQNAEWVFVNASDTYIPILNFSGALQYLLAPSEKCELVPSDKSTQNGVWELEVYAGNPKDFDLFDDFFPALATTGNIGQLGWVLTGTNGTATAAYQASTTNKAGIIQVSTATANNAAASLNLGLNNLVPGQGRLAFETFFMVPTLGGTGAAALTLQPGFTDAANAADAANGYYFEYAGTAAGTINWACKTANASSRTTVTTGVAVNAGQWYKLSIAVASDNSQALFFIDGILVATITTTLPTVALGPNLKSFAGGTNAAAKSFQVDYARTRFGRNTVR